MSLDELQNLIKNPGKLNMPVSGGFILPIRFSYIHIHRILNELNKAIKQ